MPESPSTPRTDKTPNRGYVERWGGHEELFPGSGSASRPGSGYLPVPSVFLREYSRLKPYSLTHGEALFVLHLMDFKWDREPPFPSYKRLASRMGVTSKMVRRHAIALERKGYLKRVARHGSTNLFDLTPLFTKLKEIVVADSTHLDR